MRACAPLAAATPQQAIALTLADAAAQGVAAARLVAISGPFAGPCGSGDANLRRRAAWRRGWRSTAASWRRRPTRCSPPFRQRPRPSPNGLARRRLAAALPQVSSPVLDAVLAALAKAARVEARGGLVQLAPRREAAAALAEREAATAAALAQRLRNGGLAPPDLSELAPTPAARRALERLLKDGEAVKTFDRVHKREIVFHRDAVAAARAALRPRLATPGLTVGEAGAALGMSRKFSVPLLEHLDAVRFSRRLGDRRVLGPAAGD